MKKVKNDVENPKLIGKYSLKNIRFNWTLNKVVFDKKKSVRLSKKH
jgi:hypothetical protein